MYLKSMRVHPIFSGQRTHIAILLLDRVERGDSTYAALRMATSETLPQRPTRKSRRLRGQEPKQATPEKAVGSAATPPWGALPLQGQHFSQHPFYGLTHVMLVACPSLAFTFICTLLLISHAIITGFACIYCILFLYYLALASLRLYYFNEMFFTFVALVFHCQIHAVVFHAREPHPFWSSRSREITRA